MKRFKHVAELFRDARRIRAMSQTELSEALEYKNGQYISNIERGLCSVSEKRIVSVCRVLDLPANLLIEAMAKDYKEHLEEVLSEVINETSVCGHGDIGSFCPEW